jgi:hypothetical protein
MDLDEIFAERILFQDPSRQKSPIPFRLLEIGRLQLYSDQT